MVKIICLCYVLGNNNDSYSWLWRYNTNKILLNGCHINDSTDWNSYVWIHDQCNRINSRLNKVI